MVPKPRLLRAADGVEALVPPMVIGVMPAGIELAATKAVVAKLTLTSPKPAVTPVAAASDVTPMTLSVEAMIDAGVVAPIDVLSIVPPVIVTDAAGCVAMLYRPKFNRAIGAVVAPVPPEVIGTTPPVLPLAITNAVVASLVELSPSAAVTPSAPCRIVAPVTVRVDKVAACGVVAPIMTLSMLPLTACKPTTSGAGYVPPRSPVAGPIGELAPTTRALSADWV